MKDNIEKLETLKKIEFLKNAKTDTDNSVRSLRLAGNNSNPVEHLIIMQLLEKAIELNNDISFFMNAIESNEGD